MNRYTLARIKRTLRFQDLTYKYQPNFSIIIPGECNAQCSFCFWKCEKPHEKYMARLLRVLEQLPRDIFTQVSLTGGEPTLNPDLNEIVKLCKDRFDKVVLTTNGARLKTYLSKEGTLPSFINISRHGINFEECVEIFNTSTIPSDKDLIAINEKLEKAGICSTMNVVCSSFEDLDFQDYINYAKKLKFWGLCFRKDHTKGKDTSKLKHTIKWQNENPVSKTVNCVIDDMPVELRSSELESTKIVDYCHELVYHPSGKLTLDWEGKIVMSIDEDLLLSLMEEIKSLRKEVSEFKEGFDLLSQGKKLASGRREIIDLSMGSPSAGTRESPINRLRALSSPSGSDIGSYGGHGSGGH